MTYSDKLKSPKWQKKRLEILDIHKFKCDECKSEEKTLHVHHRFYLKGREPWQYDNDVFQVLCEDCHTKEHVPKEKVVFAIPKRYKQLIEFLNPFDDNVIHWFSEGICNTVNSENMDEFNTAMSYVAAIGFDDGFADIIAKNRAEENDIELHSRINELRYQVEYLVKMTGFKKPESNDFEF